MKHIKGNILNVKNGYIFHIYESGFSASLFEKFPNLTLPEKNYPGTVFIFGEEKSPDIVNMFLEGVFEQRQKYFQKCLNAMFDYFEFSSEKVFIHVPYKLGCNFSQSEWEHYVKSLLDFEEKMTRNNIDVELTIYH